MFCGMVFAAGMLSAVAKTPYIQTDTDYINGATYELPTSDISETLTFYPKKKTFLRLRVFSPEKERRKIISDWEKQNKQFQKSVTATIASVQISS